MLFHKAKSSTSCCTLCAIGMVTIVIFAVLALVLSLIGVYMAHVLPAGFTFGTVQASMSVIALVLTLALLLKLSSHCSCPLPVVKKKK